MVVLLTLSCDRLQFLLKSHFPALVVNGDPDKRLAGNLHD
jgi:hypothetical protein